MFQAFVLLNPFEVIVDLRYRMVQTCWTLCSASGNSGWGGDAEVRRHAMVGRSAGRKTRAQSHAVGISGCRAELVFIDRELHRARVIPRRRRANHQLQARPVRQFDRPGNGHDHAGGGGAERFGELDADTAAADFGSFAPSALHHLIDVQGGIGKDQPDRI